MGCFLHPLGFWVCRGWLVFRVSSFCFDLPFDVLFLGDLSCVRFSGVSGVFSLGSLRVCLPRGSGFLFVRSRSWVDFLFSDDFRSSILIFGGLPACPFSIVRDTIGRLVPYGVFSRLCRMVFGFRYPYYPRNVSCGKFEYVYLAAIISDRVGEIYRVDGVESPLIPPKIYSEEGALLAGLWSSDGFLKYDHGRKCYAIVYCGYDYGIRRVFMDSVKGVIGGVKFQSSRHTIRASNKAVSRVAKLLGMVVGRKTITDPRVPSWIRRDSKFASKWFLGVFLGDGTSYLSKTGYLRVEYIRAIDLEKKLLDAGFSREERKRIISSNWKIIREYGRFTPRSEEYYLTPRKCRELLPIWSFILRAKPNFLIDESKMLAKFLGVKSLLHVHTVRALKSGRVTIHWKLSLNGMRAYKFLKWIGIEGLKEYGIKKVNKALREMKAFRKNHKVAT
ncbi:MAG: hypothetical protein ACTSVA_04810 [Candidatus Njordarchaeales archaeon]